MISNPAMLNRRAVLGMGVAAPFISRRAVAALPPIIDAIGRTVRLAAPAARIVLCFNFEEFTAVAGPSGWDRVVGFSRTQWAVNRAAIFKRYIVPIPRLADLPDVGTSEDGSFSMERTLSLRPDLLVVPEWSRAALGPQMQQLDALGIPVLFIDYNSEIPGRHVASTIALGIATGNEERARTIASLYLTKLADIARRIEGVASRPKAYVELAMGGPSMVGNTYWKGMWGRLLDRAGATNVAAEHIPGAYAPLDPEYVLASDPDAIFLAGSSWAGQPNAVTTGFDADEATTRARLAPYTQRQGWPQLTAVRTGQVFAVEHGLCRALFDYAPTYFIAKAIHPAEFADIDPVDELRRYHAQFLPVAFEGTWMARITALPA